MTWLTGLFTSFFSGIVKNLLVDLFNWLKSLFDYWLKKKAEGVQEVKDATKYEDVISKPGVTREEQSAAEDSLFNRRH